MPSYPHSCSLLDAICWACMHSVGCMHDCQHLPAQVADTAVEVVSPEYITGPVMGGEPAGAEATKAAFLPLPPAALPSI